MVAMDVVVLLPQAALLPLVRQAWAEAVGGWMPRFETVGTLLERLPAVEGVNVAPGDVTLDAATDLLSAMRLLRADPAVREWAQESPGSLEFATERMIEMAHAWLHGALQRTPSERQDWVEQARAWLRAQGPAGNALGEAVRSGVPGARETWCQAWALRWALDSLSALQSRSAPLFDHVPAAWVAVTVGSTVSGGESALMLALLRHGQSQGLPALWTPATVGGGADGAGVSSVDCGSLAPRLHLATDGEDEARAAAAFVLEAVNECRRSADPRPVVLVAQDRVLTRRVHALLAPLESQEGPDALRLIDESGWKLSTTRAAAAVMRLLVAAAPRAKSDDLLDWLLSGWAQPPGSDASAVDSLEWRWRRDGRLLAWGEGDESPVWTWARDALAPLQSLAGRRQQSLSEALAVLADTLRRVGTWSALQADEAGQQVLSALRLAGADPAEPAATATATAAFEWAASGLRMNLAELSAWVQQTLESATFMPPPPEGAADVLITPVSRAVLRPFAAVIVPGADDAQLGVLPASGWLSPGLLSAWGLATPEVQRQSQWEAFALLACGPQVTALSRQVREGEPVGPSPWLARWWLGQGGDFLAHGWPLIESPAVPVERRCEGVPTPAPVLDTPGREPLWPQRLSASGYERLRTCPYQYFALHLLGLKALDEIEEGLPANDYGAWLHAVLHDFHRERQAQGAPAEPLADTERWLHWAHEHAREFGLDGDALRPFFAPYAVSLAALARGYVDWARSQEAQGWCWRDGEVTLRRMLELPDGQGRVWLEGQLDRVDAHGSGPLGGCRVMDYKSGALQALKDKVKLPLEDTQLAFYAALARSVLPLSGGLEAAYLRVHADELALVPHPEVEASADALEQGIAHDFGRIAQGHALRPLGEGVACERCDVRGLCRKDHILEPSPGARA